MESKTFYELTSAQYNLLWAHLDREPLGVRWFWKLFRYIIEEHEQISDLPYFR